MGGQGHGHDEPEEVAESQLTPDETFDLAGTVDALTAEDLDQLEAEAAADDAEALLAGDGTADEQPDPEAEKAWVELADDEPDEGGN